MAARRNGNVQGDGASLEQLVIQLAGALERVRPGNFLEDPQAERARLRYQALRDAIRGYDPYAEPPPPPLVTVEPAEAPRGDLVLLRGAMLDDRTVVLFGGVPARITRYDPHGKVLAAVVPDEAAGDGIVVLPEGGQPIQVDFGLVEVLIVVAAE